MTHKSRAQLKAVVGMAVGVALTSVVIGLIEVSITIPNLSILYLLIVYLLIVMLCAVSKGLVEGTRRTDLGRGDPRRRCHVCLRAAVGQEPPVAPSDITTRIREQPA